MATFPSIDPSYPVKKTSKPNTRTIKFGDGYEHRLLFGLNQNPKEFSLTWKDLSETDSDTIETFLDARANDGDSFSYTPPNEPSSMQFKCSTWSKDMNYSNLATINATFIQVFEPIS
tara:strand:+ start:760 stop:1110 length:351 start_codon:yes stop_codon:yes gene_type:complete